MSPLRPIFFSVMTKKADSPKATVTHGIWDAAPSGDLDAVLSASTETPVPSAPLPVTGPQAATPEKKEPAVRDSAPTPSFTKEVAPKSERPRREVASAELISTMEKVPVKTPASDSPSKNLPPSSPNPNHNPNPNPNPNPKTDFIFKPMERLKRSGFRDFLGAVKTFGLGKEKMALIQNLATMLDAGLPLVDSLKTLQADTRSRAGRQLLKKIVDAVENGSPLWRAFEDQHCFPPDVIALVRIGEEAGNLAENMSYLAIQQEKDAALRSKVTMAMIYPTIVMVIMLIIVMGLGLFVLPNLIGVLFSLNVPLPFVTRMVIAFTNFFSTQGPVAVPGVFGTVLLLIILGKFTRLKRGAQWIMFHIPGIGKLAREATIARFGVILGGLLQAGVPLVDSIRSLAEVTSIVAYKNFYLRLLDHVTIGDSFGKSFVAIRGSAALLPVTVQQLVTTGERSGSLAKILLKIADIYEKKANDTAQKLPVILEPILLLFIGSLVGTIALAIIVPIYSIVGNVGQ